MPSRAQGTIEYLVIVGVVVVISLIVVVLLINQSSSAGASSQKSYASSWLSQSAAVTDLVVDSTGNGTIVIKNNLPGKITVTSVKINGVIVSQSKDVFFGEQKTLSLVGIANCNAQGGTYDVEVTYLTESGISKKESGKFYTNCVANGLVTKSLSLTTADATVGTNTTIASGYLILSSASALNTRTIEDFTAGTNADSNLSISATEIKLKTS